MKSPQQESPFSEALTRDHWDVPIRVPPLALRRVYRLAGRGVGEAGRALGAEDAPQGGTAAATLRRGCPAVALLACPAVQDAAASNTAGQASSGTRQASSGTKPNAANGETTIATGPRRRLRRPHTSRRPPLAEPAGRCRHSGGRQQRASTGRLRGRYRGMAQLCRVSVGADDAHRRGNGRGVRSPRRRPPPPKTPPRTRNCRKRRRRPGRNVRNAGRRGRLRCPACGATGSRFPLADADPSGVRRWTCSTCDEPFVPEFPGGCGLRTRVRRRLRR